MRRPRGRWLGIGIAVLVVGVLIIIAGGSQTSPSAAGVETAGSSMPSSAPPAPAVISTGTALALTVKVGIVAALLGGSLWLLRRYAGVSARAGGRSGAVYVADTIPLAQGRALYVLDVGDRALVIGATAQQIALVGEVTDAATLEKLRTPPERPAWPLADVARQITGGGQDGASVRGDLHALAERLRAAREER